MRKNSVVENSKRFRDLSEKVENFMASHTFILKTKVEKLKKS